MNPDYVPSAEKLADHARFEKWPTRNYIATNANDYATWHIGRAKKSIGPNSGLILGVYYVTACSGRVLGGAYGYRKSETVGSDWAMCPRCLAWEKKHKNK